jgi:hypothetical protein
VTDFDEVFRRLDRFVDVPFMEDGRQQPPMPEPEDLFDGPTGLASSSPGSTREQPGVEDEFRAGNGAGLR